MVNFMVWLILGAIVGWLASRIRLPNAQRGTLIDIVVGAAGAFVAGLVFTPLFSPGPISQNNLSLPALEVSLLGAVILLGVVKFFRRGGATAA